ncbi:Aste57867_4168 [Aphanomyces stellatus]|uniref:Aste57867_4168 protein n=1 Tax=Aphanomyces stellatus TaxID=120398 RepID=A0A485KCP4_9STRA|nr:hypothetical protein As57867_004157 [Aphanomyces stellatus]VFT81294.1 Aste57867_4168 [Aphanomyces stellatus]
MSRHVRLLCAAFASILFCIHASWISSRFVPESTASSLARRLTAPAPNSVGFVQPTAGANTNLSMVVTFAVDAPDNAAVVWQLPPPFAYVDLVTSATVPSLTIDGQPSVTTVVTRNQTSHAITFTLSASVVAGSAFHLNLLAIVPPTSGLPDTFTARLVSPSGLLLDSASAQPSAATQPAPLNLAYVGVQSQRATQDAGIILAFTPSVPVPATGAYVLQLSSLFNLPSPIGLHVLAGVSGTHTASTGPNNIVKVQRNGDGGVLSPGSTVVFWLSNVVNPAMSGLVGLGGLATETTEGWLLEQATLTTSPIYSNVTTCLSQCAAGFYASSFNLTSDTCVQCPAGSFCPGGCAAPTPCVIGTASAAPQATSSATCQACPAGSTALTPGSSTCTPCPAGMACASPSALPVACSANAFNLGGAAACTPCLAGFACPQATLPPVACTSGSYSLAVRLMAHA